MVRIVPIARVAQCGESGSQPLSKVLARAEDHKVRVYLDPSHKSRMKSLHSATGRAEYEQLGKAEYIEVSIAHLVDLPPETPVLLGFETHWDLDEATHFGPDPDGRR